MKFSDVETYLSTYLNTNYGYRFEGLESGAKQFVVIAPGPATAAQMQTLAAGSLVFASVGGGAGLTKESTFDRLFISVRVAGEQNDYDSAEDLAQAIDHAFLVLGGNATVGTAKVLSITRAAGPPELLSFDTSKRYNFSCTYIAEAQTGI